jgi:hypothetical protein
MCEACPFNLDSELAYQVQNYGCLPTGKDNMDCFDRNGYSISCHENNKKHCNGLLEFRTEAAKKPVLGYSDWYQGKTL